MQKCPICSKSLKRLSKHLSRSHKACVATKPCDTLKEFARLLIHIPITPIGYNRIVNNEQAILEYIENDKDLPEDIFSTIYQAFERYREQKIKPALINYATYTVSK